MQESLYVKIQKEIKMLYKIPRTMQNLQTYCQIYVVVKCF